MWKVDLYAARKEGPRNTEPHLSAPCPALLPPGHPQLPSQACCIYCKQRLAPAGETTRGRQPRGARVTPLMTRRPARAGMGGQVGAQLEQPDALVMPTPAQLTRSRGYKTLPPSPARSLAFNSVRSSNRTYLRRLSLQFDRFVHIIIVLKKLCSNYRAQQPPCPYPLP